MTQQCQRMTVELKHQNHINLSIDAGSKCTYRFPFEYIHSLTLWTVTDLYCVLHQNFNFLFFFVSISMWGSLWPPRCYPPIITHACLHIYMLPSGTEVLELPGFCAIPGGCVPERWSCKSWVLRIPAKSLQLFTYIALILQFLWCNTLRAWIEFCLQESWKISSSTLKQTQWPGTAWSLSAGQTQEHKAAKSYSKIKIY